MEFDQVTQQHILKGISDYKEKGLPDGFGPSSTYDLVFEGEKYPPKAIMVYANYHAIGRKIERYFKGGLGTDCFKAFERNGFKVIEKVKNNKSMALYQLKDEFLQEWPLERIKTMSLEEYTNTEREDSFCYWLEQKTELLGGIRGGSSYKFGIYKMSENSETKAAHNRTNNGVYAWHLKYGKTQEEAFQSVREIIYKIATCSTENNFNTIDEIDLGDAYKWKIAFLYSDYKVFNVFNKASLQRIVLGLNQKLEDSVAISELNQAIILQKPNDESYFDYSNRMWNDFGKENPVASEFEKWLRKSEIVNSKKVGSYLRAIDILVNYFKIRVYEEQDVTVLKTLYLDLKKHQKDANGKYHYLHAPSYGMSGFYSASIKSYIAFLDKSITSNTETMGEVKSNKKKLNQILYGPPGTGKTYNTISAAIAIANPDFDISQDRAILKEEYNRLSREGLIVFTTFHQSMSYEDFIEGIKPNLNEEEGDVTYQIDDGIFKTIADRAKGIEGEVRSHSENIDFKNCNYFKMSIGGKNRKDIHDWSIASNKIAIGYGGNNDLNLISSNDSKPYKTKFQEHFPEEVEKSKFTISATNAFKNGMQKGDIVMVSLGNHIIDAIGVIKGDYEYNVVSEIPYKHFREVAWIATDLNANPNLFVDKGISQQTIYQFNTDDVKISYLESMVSKKENKSSDQNFVLIIDEINRGNVSQIFGELITLIEEDKRLGNSEALQVQLPYSKMPFGVPQNLYIIGTMNTADRSVEALDTALRRRFIFKEVIPKPELLEKISYYNFNLKQVLEAINQRIEVLLDRDHTIGHSYFIKLKSGDTNGLLNVFKNSIIPLLQEYFYNDYEKIALVLGEGFVSEKADAKVKFAKFKNIEVPEIETSYELVPNVDSIELAVGLLLNISNE